MLGLSSTLLHGGPLPHGALIPIKLTPLGLTLHILFSPNTRGHFMFLGLTFCVSSCIFIMIYHSFSSLLDMDLFFRHFIMQNKALKCQTLPKFNVCLQLLPLSTPSKLSSCSQNLVMTPFIGLTYEGGFSRNYFSNPIGYR